MTALIKINMEPTQQRFEVEDGDSTAIFPIRKIGGETIVLIPKHQFKLDITESVYVLTLKNPPLQS